MSKCLWCGDLVTDAEKEFGKQANLLKDGECQKVWVHRECELMQVVGTITHQRRECICFGGTKEHDSGLTKRQDAIISVSYYEHNTSLLVERLSDV